jgi:hypothetical protein
MWSWGDMLKIIRRIKKNSKKLDNLTVDVYLE